MEELWNLNFVLLERIVQEYFSARLNTVKAEKPYLQTFGAYGIGREPRLSLSQLAVDGTCEPWGCKFTVTVPEMIFRGIIEIIPCTAKAVESIKAVPEWKA